MEIKKLKNLLKKEEGTKLDFKRKIDIYTEMGKKELAKDVCAIANSKGGRGYIVIGVEDKTKEIVGIEKDSLSEEKIQQIISSRCEPPIPITLEFINYKGKVLGIIIIYTANQRPYQVREHGSFYIRRGSTTDVMRRNEILSQFQQSFSLNIESIPISNTSIVGLDYELVDRYFHIKKIEIENKQELMENASITYNNKETGETLLTLGGILIFSKNSSIYLPHSIIKIINRTYKKDEVIILDGNILTLINKVETVLKNMILKEYPINALLEAVNNAIIYRDYTLYNKIIEIYIDYNSIIVISPGSATKIVDGNKATYEKRNMWLYEKILTLDEKGRFANKLAGFNIIKRAFKKKGTVHFINDQHINTFKVILPGIKNFANELL